MKSKAMVKTVIGLLVMIMLVAAPTWAAHSEQGIRRVVSANVPLESDIYLCLHKLAGLGYLKGILPDTKPYTRTQVAGWLKQMLDETATGSVPVYAQAMLARLETEFAWELSLLRGSESRCGFAIKEANWVSTYYDGITVKQPETLSHYQPLNINNNGYRFGDGLNSSTSLRLEGRFYDSWVLSATPRVSYDATEDFSAGLTSGYVKTRIGNLGIQLGKDEMWWGPGVRGNLTLTNNAAPLTSLKLTNVEPVRPKGMFGFLRQMDGAFFYSELKDGGRQVKGPSFVGFRATVTPAENFSLSGTLNSMVGGEGHNLSGREYAEFFTGKNAENSETDKWNSIAGFDFRWRIPHLMGMEFYGEYFGEDQAGKVPLPCRNAYIAGVYVPRLTRDGKWDLALEKGRTNQSWYIHWLYKEGWVYKDNLLGDAMGHNAERIYLQASRYLSDGSTVAFNAEMLTMEADAQDPRQVDSFWLTYRRSLKPGLTLNATLGTADVEPSNLRKDPSEHCLLLSLGLNKQF